MSDHFTPSNDELKEALEGVLFLIDGHIPTKYFRNGIEDSGFDMGEVHAKHIIAGAKQVLSAHMTNAEKENSPIF